MKVTHYSLFLTRLSKAFDCIDHTLLIAKLSAFGVSPLSVKVIYSYLSNQTLRIIIDRILSDRTDIEFGATQGSVFGTLLFNIDIIDLFYKYEDSNASSYADDTKPYSCVTNIPSAALELLTSATKLFRWHKNNHLKDNQESPIFYLVPRTLRLFQLMYLFQFQLIYFN